MDMWNELEDFTLGGSSSRGTEPRITLNNRGDITFNKLAYDKLNDEGKVILGFSKEKGVIGIRPAKESEIHAFVIKPLSKSKSRVIRAKGFCRHHNIIPPQTVSFNDIKFDDVGVLLDLNNVTKVAPRKRRKKKNEDQKAEQSSSGFSWGNN